MGKSDIPVPDMKPERATLRDGSTVLVRPICPDDKGLLKEALARLSARSRYQRFGMAVRELSADQLKYLTEIDNDNHVAWVAIYCDGEKERVVGVARYVRVEQNPTMAEVAVTVADSHQGRGLGTLLLAKLAESARINGVHSFLAFVFSYNVPVLKLAREFGSAVKFLGSGLFRVTGAVPEISVDGPQYGL